MALTISGTSNGKLGNLSLSNRTANVLDSGDTTFFGADHWRITSNYSLPAAAPNSYFLTSNWERDDSTGSGLLGNGMTESSGVFTFPSTGIYFIQFEGNAFRNAGDFAYCTMDLYATTDNSTYNVVVRKNANAFQGSGYTSLVVPYIIDVTDTSLVKVKIAVIAEFAGVNFQGETDKTRTGATFTRLGDT